MSSDEKTMVEEEEAAEALERAKALTELRQRFASEYESNEAWIGKISENDVSRFKTQDWWPSKFLDRYDNDLDVAFPAFVEALKWRQKFEVDSGESSILTWQLIFV